ncbi:MAG: tetratricopeptide repeat protein [PVC group bacterium]|nr:tetratricopeptide repeat protein [PVC group bacterium]
MKDLVKNVQKVLSSKRDIILLILIVLVSLTVRGVYLHQLQSTPLFGFFSADSYLYNILARQIQQGNFTSLDSTCMNPLYPVFLAVLYYILGQTFIVVAIFQIALDLITCLMLYFIAIRVFKRKSVGLIAAFIYSCYGIAIFFTGFLLGTTLVTFLYVLLMFMVLSAYDRDSRVLWLCSGIIAGLSLLLRANLLIFLPFLIFWYWNSTGHTLKRKVVAMLLLIFGICIALLPFAIRNYKIENRISPFSVHGGLNFYIGNNPQASGTYMTLPGISGSPLEQADSSMAIARRETAKELSAVEVSQYWVSKAWSFILGKPGHSIRLLLRKAVLFWSAEELQGNLNYYFCRKFIPILRLPLLPFVLIGPLGLLGMIFALRDKKKEPVLLIFFIIAYLVSLVLYFVTSRHRFPCIPFIIIFAAYAVDSFTALLFNKKKKETGIAVILLLIFIVFSLAPGRSAEAEKNFFVAYTNLGMAYYRQGKIDKAVKEYEHAIRLNPRYAEAQYKLGIIYLEKNEHDKAIETFRKVVKLNPYDTDAYNNLGVVFTKQGLWEEAIREFKFALSVNSRSADTYNNLGIVYSEMGMLQDAVKYYQKAIDLDPQYTEAYYNLGTGYQKQGMMQKAIETYKKTIDVNPSFISTYNNLAFIYEKKGMLSEAMKVHEKAASLNPKSAIIYYNLGNIYYKRRKFSEAQQAYQMALKINPDFASAHYNLGLVFYKLGKKDKAKIEYDKSAQLKKSFADIPYAPKINTNKPDNSNLERNLETEGDYGMGNIFLAESQFDDAIDQYKKVLEADPGHADARYNLGVAYQGKGDMIQAVVEYQKTIQINPAHAEAYNNLAVYNYYENNFERAIDYADKALDLGYKVDSRFLEMIKIHRKEEK